MSFFILSILFLKLSTDHILSFPDVFPLIAVLYSFFLSPPAFVNFPIFNLFFFNFLSFIFLVLFPLTYFFLLHFTFVRRFFPFCLVFVL